MKASDSRDETRFDENLVSIITPVYNAVRTIGETMDSVCAQTYFNWEHIIIDDSSTDGTSELVAGRAAVDPRIRHVKLPGRSGPARARNSGFAAAAGRYIAFLDADDLWLPEKLERQIRFMREAGAGLSYTSFRRISEEGTSTGRQMPIPETVTYAQLLQHNPIGCLTVVIDREKVGQFEMRDDINEDFTLWLQLLRRGVEARGLDEDLARYRVVRGSRSSNKLAAARWRWRVYREVEKLPLGFSAWCFSMYAIRTLSKHWRF